MNNANSKIIRTFIIITFTYTLSTSLIWGINTLFLLDAGMNIFQVFIINAVYSASMAVFEIPTGVFADTLGRRMSFLFSTFVMMIGTIGYVFVARLPNNFSLFCSMSIVLGLAYTFYSGAVEAWLVDALHEKHFEGTLDSVFAKGNIVSSIAMLIGTTSGGFIGTLNLSFPYVLRAVIQLFVFIFAFFTMHDLGYKKKPLTIRTIPSEMKSIASKSVKFGVKNISIRYLMMITFVFSSFMMWGWYAWQPYFLDLYGNKNAVWLVGLISAMLTIAQIIGSLLLNRFKKLFKKRSSILFLSYSIQTATILVVGFTNSFIIAVIAFIIFASTLGLIFPLKQSYLHSLIPSEHRATIISFDSLIGSTGSVFGQVGYGFLSEKISISSGYIVGGFASIFIFPIIRLLAKREKKENKPS
jgi:MFS family permease